ncbi:MAG: hypothetical protein IJJ10_03240 [Bacillus sp. (in: Bacteria)]|nr:hypothetical protein [Bacillus sp. (in: firmicutes)]
MNKDLIPIHKNNSNVLCHFNPNHDPDTGKFTTGSGTGIRLSKKSNKSVDKSFNTISSNARQISNTVGSIEQRKAKNSIRNEAKQMSDADLQKVINRLSNEQRYVDLVSNDVNSGKVQVREILEIAGSAAAIGLTAYTLLKR